MLDLNDFPLFVQVVDRGGFTAAGTVLHVSRATLSRRIRRLEGELGVRLLARAPGRFVLTEEGADFYARAAAVLDEAARAESVARGCCPAAVLD